MAGAGGGPRFAAPSRALFPGLVAALAPGESSRVTPTPHRDTPCAPRLPPRAQRSLPAGPRRPSSLRPRRRRPHFTSAAGRAPRFGGPLSASAGGRASGRASEQLRAWLG